MARTNAITQRTLAPGTYSFGPFSLTRNNAATQRSVYQLFCNRVSFPDTSENVARVTIEVSYDRGATWPDVYSLTFAGNPGIDPATGLPATWCGVTIPTGPANNNTRRIRLTAEIFQAITISIDKDELWP